MSFSRHVGASALCLSAFLAPAAVSAQQPQLYHHQGCFYRTPNAAPGTMVGCNVAIAGRTMWADSGRNAFYDPKTRLWFKVGDAANNIYALTHQGWVLIQLAPGGAQLLAELRPHGNQGTNIIVGPPAGHPLEDGRLECRLDRPHRRLGTAELPAAAGTAVPRAGRRLRPPAQQRPSRKASYRAPAIKMDASLATKDCRRVVSRRFCSPEGPRRFWMTAWRRAQATKSPHAVGRRAGFLVSACANVTDKNQNARKFSRASEPMLLSNQHAVHVRNVSTRFDQNRSDSNQLILFLLSPKILTLRLCGC